jgi:hypothetical protein
MGVWGGSLSYHAPSKTLHLLGGFRDSLNPMIKDTFPVYKYFIDSNLWFATGIQNPAKQRSYTPSVVYKDNYAIFFGGVQITFEGSRTNDDCFHRDIVLYDMSKSH